MAGHPCVSHIIACLFLSIALIQSHPAFSAPSTDTFADRSEAPATPHVIGGSVSADGRWPFVVAIVSVRPLDNYFAQFCAGSLVHRRFVLTAAHCVEGDAARDINVLVGTQNLGSGGRRIAVSRIVIHRSYDAETGDFDIALLRLTTDVTGIRPVRLLPLRAERRFAPTGRTAITMGWGDTARGDSVRYPKRMHEARVELVARRRCNQEKAYAGEVTPRMVCAGLPEGGRDSCQGDSGGPLVVRDARKRFRLQVGIVSWGEGCARRNKPGVYTRVPRLEEWVRRVIAANF
jgi:secreted trypsin-like serine protease